MQVAVLHTQDTSHLDEVLLDAEGFCRMLPAEELLALNRVEFRLWCYLHGVYQYPTVELIDFLRDEIGGRTAIEVASGMGNIGRLLGIPMTDSHMQTIPEIDAYYRSLGQAPIHPPACVEKIDAVDAVEKYRPQVVVACWLTHKWQPGMSEGNDMGVDEHLILDRVESYIHVGNDRVHSAKPIWSRQHTKHYRDWLVSRATDESVSHVAVWSDCRR